MTTKIVVTDTALREFLNEIMGNKDVRSDYDVKMPVNVNDVVDPSAELTDPTNPDHKPHSPVELQNAVKTMSDDLTVDDIPVVYDTLKQALKNNIKKSRQQSMEKKHDKSSKFEESLRRQIRRLVIETMLHNEVEEPVQADDDENEHEEPHRKNNVAVDGGKTLHDIAHEMQISVAGAKRLEREGQLKSQWVAKQDPELFEEFLLDQAHEYIEDKLVKSGELSKEDVDFLYKHPEVVAELPNFRESFLHRTIHKYIKSGKDLTASDIGLSDEQV